MNATACKYRLEQLLRKELADWQGLPEACAEEDVARSFPLRPGEGIAHFGSELVEYRFRVIESAGFTEPVRLYFRDATLRLVRTGLWSTDRAECAQLLRDLGDPPDRLDLTFDVRTIAGGEWVYAARGLTLGVIPDTGLIAAMAAYPPCSIKAYRQSFYDVEPVREFRSRPSSPA
ncbi:MAG TPA: hypothetical protein VKR56_11255 [Candidatus Cybelea sp.]|nr:hypothetical protein [Candidatus Cybelea sp.]